ncbi:MAG: hypothetical protein PHT41_07140 [Candidatus Omnitrophica bacterium]|nr:hypothetical protein [Candidatus Omnitrophota bacterium]MDD5238617.1 hypothetical protein [Candidatus Omnitrophota bacterium]
MKVIAHITIALGILLLFIGVTSRVTFYPVPMIKGGLTGQALFITANTCFLLSIIFILLEMLKK